VVLGIFPALKQLVEDTGRVVLPRLFAPNWGCKVAGDCLSELVQPHAVCLTGDVCTPHKIGTQTELEDFVGDSGREWGMHCSFESMLTLNFAENFAR